MEDTPVFHSLVHTPKYEKRDVVHTLALSLSIAVRFIFSFFFLFINKNLFRHPVGICNFVAWLATTTPTAPKPKKKV